MTKPSLGILIVEADQTLAEELGAALLSQGHQVSAVVAEAQAALQMRAKVDPDLAVLGAAVDASGPQLAQELNRQAPLPVVLLLDPDQPQPDSVACKDLVHCWLPRPVDPIALGAVVQATYQSFERIGSLQREVEVLGRALDDRKIMERAKGMLMEAHGMDADQATEAIERLAGEQGIDFAQAARAVVEAHAADSQAHGAKFRPGGREYRPG